MQQYHYPLEDGFTERIHTPGGVRSLVEGSHLMKFYIALLLCHSNRALAKSSAGIGVPSYYRGTYAA